MIGLLKECSAGNPGALSVCCMIFELLGESAFHTSLVDGSAMAKLQSCPDSRFYANGEKEYTRQQEYTEFG